MHRLEISYAENIQTMRRRLRVSASYDIIERHLTVLERDMCFFYIDGFTKDGEMQRIMQFLLNLKEGFDASSIELRLPYVEVERTSDVERIAVAVLSGQCAVLAESFGGEAILIDARTYPARNTEEPSGDRVMQVRNNYEIEWTRYGKLGMGIFNGDCGVVDKIDRQNNLIRIFFDDREVDYDMGLLSELELAYAMTVHKSQGSEYRAVVLAAWGGSPYLLNRSILYTAITRAKNLLILVGSRETLQRMIDNDRKTLRYTGLRPFLQRFEEMAL